MAHTPDDGFHEIQLNGKQLVFLFMTATVVSVVIFLLGVLVGRSVPLERSEVADARAVAEEGLPAADLPATPAPAEPGSDPTKAEPPPTVDELSDFKRLEGEQPPNDALKPASERAAPASPAVQTRPEPPPVPAATAGSGSSYVVQIAALNARAEADAMAKRIASKGYQAYVQPPVDGTRPVYRVRIGPFKTRREADSTAAKIRKEEQLNPWVTQP